MTRPIESVVAEALQRLERTGRLDVSAYVGAYPEHASELRDLLPAMLALHQEKHWQQAESESRAFAKHLFTQLAPQADTLGSLISRERQEAGLSLEDQARRAGLPAEALRDLSQDSTPIGALDNATIKSLAGRVAAPFGALAKEVRRLLSLSQLSRGQAVFTRDRDTSTEAEQQELIDKVKESARKPPGNH